MIQYKPVEISKLSFAFCRYTMAVALWISLIFKLEWVLAFSALIFLVSAILKIKNSPLISLSDFTIDKIIKSSKVIVNEKAMLFAHLLGFIISIICLLLVICTNNLAWIVVGLFAVLKSISAIGFCPASKLYECLFNGSCCINS